MNEPAEVIQKPEASLNDFDRSLGTDELNLCEFPLASLSTRTEPGQTTLQFEDSVHDSGTNSLVHRTLMVTGSEHFGLPTATDNDILLVLIHLSNVRNRFQDKQVEFTRYELIKFLGWAQDGRSYKRLDESLMRWTTVALHYKHAWWDRSGRRWKSRSFHVIGSLELRGRDEFRDDGRSCFTWDDAIFASFSAGNLKRIDLNVYFSLKLATSRQMYRFLDKRFWHKSQLEFDLRQFATEHIGLSRRYDNHEIKRKLAPALKELQSIGFLAHAAAADMIRKAAPGKWLIVLSRTRPEQPIGANDSKWESELTSRGVSSNVARKLTQEYPPEHLAGKIKLHDALVANRDRRVSRNPAGFLASAIRHDYQQHETTLPRIRNPTAHQTRPTAVAGRQIATTTVSRRTSVQNDRNVAFQAFWKSLPPDTQMDFEREAVQQAPPFHKDTLLRLRTSDHALAAELRTQLLQTHWAMKSQGDARTRG